MKRTTLLLFAALILSAASFFFSNQKSTTFTGDSAAKSLLLASAKTDSSIVTTRTIGPITIGRDHLMNVYVQVTHVHLANLGQYGWPDSDTSFVVVDSLGRELYRRRSVNEPGGAKTDFDSYQFTIPTVGSTMACWTSIDPSYGDQGVDTQFLGLDSNNRLIPFTSLMPDGATNVVFLDSRNMVEPTFVDSSRPYAQAALEIQYSVGSFEVRGYFHVYPNGFTEGKQPNTYNFDKWPVIIDPSETQKRRKRSDRTDSTVLLWDKPNKEGPGTNRVRVGVDSKIKFLDATYRGDWWLHVIIDDHEGYISKQEFGTLGLPDAD